MSDGFTWRSGPWGNERLFSGAPGLRARRRVTVGTKPLYRAPAADRFRPPPDGTLQATRLAGTFQRSPAFLLRSATLWRLHVSFCVARLQRTPRRPAPTALPT